MKEEDLLSNGPLVAQCTLSSPFFSQTEAKPVLGIQEEHAAHQAEYKKAVLR